METYTLKEIKQLAKEQNFSHAALFDNNGVKLINYNKAQQPILEKLNEIEKKLSSKILNDGVYFVGLCSKLGRGQHVDKLAVLKGSNLGEKAAPGTVIIERTTNQSTQSENVLSYDAALRYQSEISDLKNQVLFLQHSNESLQAKIDELTEELDEIEEKKGSEMGLSGLADNGGNWFKSLMEQALPAVDRYFDIKEKQILLDEKKLLKSLPQKPQQIQIGSAEHLTMIEGFYNANNEIELNKHLDLLEAQTPELYLQVMEKLKLDTDE